MSRSEYRLTALGHSLREAVCGLDRWVETKLYRTQRVAA